MFMPLEEKTLIFALFLQRQVTRAKIVQKHRYLHCFF